MWKLQQYSIENNISVTVDLCLAFITLVKQHSHKKMDFQISSNGLDDVCRLEYSVKIAKTAGVFTLETLALCVWGFDSLKQESV